MALKLAEEQAKREEEEQKEEEANNPMKLLGMIVILIYNLSNTAVLKYQN